MNNIVVEIPLPDGSMSMFVGREVGRDADRITIINAAWIASTGRRHVFFAGGLAEEVEPYPDGVELSLPLLGAVLTTWPHPLIRVPR